ncbi:MAG TPA: hypothetical protein VGI12_05125 [Vicinamibacterales bacterium]|jgi:hypothetical protein
MLLLDILNSPERIAELSQTTAPADCLALKRQVDAYRYALWQFIGGRLANPLKKQRAEAIKALDLMKKAVQALVEPDRKLTSIRASVPKSQRHLRGLAEFLVFRRSPRLLTRMKRSHADVATLIRQTGVACWAELERHARADADIRGRLPVVSTRGIELSKSLEQQWARLPLDRVRRCAFSQCDIAGGRYFVARTSERDCTNCREAFSRDTRSRLKRRITLNARRRT